MERTDKLTPASLSEEQCTATGTNSFPTAAKPLGEHKSGLESSNDDASSCESCMNRRGAIKKPSSSWAAVNGVPRCQSSMNCANKRMVVDSRTWLTSVGENSTCQDSSFVCAFSSSLPLWRDGVGRDFLEPLRERLFRGLERVT